MYTPDCCKECNLKLKCTGTCHKVIKELEDYKQALKLAAETFEMNDKAFKSVSKQHTKKWYEKYFLKLAKERRNK